MDAEKLLMWVGWAMVFAFVGAGIIMLDTLSSGGTNPRLLVTMHVHGIGLGIVLLLLSRELSRIARYPTLRKVAALSSSAGALVFVSGIGLKLASVTGDAATLLEVLGAAMVAAGVAVTVAILSE